MKIDITKIMEGHFKEFLSLEQELSDKRMKVCKLCPLYKHTSVGYICDNKLYLDPLTNETSTSYKEGFSKGCMCRLAAKTRLKDAKCPVGKW